MIAEPSHGNLTDQDLTQLEAAELLGQFLNRMRPDLEGIVTDECHFHSQLLDTELIGPDEIRTYFLPYLRPGPRKIFAEVGADPVRKEICLVIHMRDSFYGRPGIGEVRSYFALRLDEFGLIDEIFAVSDMPDPLYCPRLGLFPGLSEVQLKRAVEFEGPRIARTAALGLELYVDDERVAPTLAATADACLVAERLGLPEPVVYPLSTSVERAAHHLITKHSSLRLTLDGELVRLIQGWDSAAELEALLAPYLYPLGAQLEEASSTPEDTGPIDYFCSAPSEFEAVVRRIKGDYRRTFVREGLVGESFADIPEDWLAHSLSLPLRDFLGAQHPSFRGGEDLPDLRDGEVEIARVSLATVHGEVISLRALPFDDDGFFLRLVNEEHDAGGERIELPRDLFDAPLTAAEVAALFHGAKPAQLPEGCEWRMTSYFYPDLDEVAHRAIHGAWDAESSGERCGEG